MQRKAHWEQVYANKSPLEVSWYQDEPTLSLELIEHSGVGSDAPLIDVGGGASLLVDRLLARGFGRLAVLDISAAAIAVAQRRLDSRAAEVEWIESDVTRFAPSHRFALWHDRAAFHFLTDAEDRARYVQVLKRTLSPDGHVVIASFAKGGPSKCSGLDIVQYDSAALSAELGPEFELQETREEVHNTPAGGQQLFAFFRFRRAVPKAL